MGRVTVDRGAPLDGGTRRARGAGTGAARWWPGPCAGTLLLAGFLPGCTGSDTANPPAGAAVTSGSATEAESGAESSTAGRAGEMPERFGFGRAATHEEIAAWNIDVMPDGTGLPAGEGTAASGGPLYARLCASCHGPSGEGATAARLVGYEPESTPPFGPRYEEWRGDGADVPFTVGNYWPYATTLYDYIQRAMPTSTPGTLAPDEVYGLVAWILAENGIIAGDAVMNAATLPAVEMPARDIFVPQER